MKNLCLLCKNDIHKQTLTISLTEKSCYAIIHFLCTCKNQVISKTFKMVEVATLLRVAGLPLRLTGWCQDKPVVPAVAFPGTRTKIHGKSPEFPGIIWDNLTLSMETPAHLRGKIPWTTRNGSMDIPERFHGQP